MLEYETGLTSEGFPNDPLSYDHRAGSAPAYVLSKYILGVIEDDSGILIKPDLSGLNHIQGAVCVKQGVIEVEWNATKDGVSFSIKLPERLKKPCSLVLNKGKGDFTFFMNGNRSKNYIVKDDNLIIQLRDSSFTGQLNYKQGDE